MKKLILLIFLGAAFAAAPTNAGLFSFTTGSPDGRMASGSRTDLGGVTEIESADDFIVPNAGIHLTNATFTGLIPSGVSLSDVTQLQIEIYRVFPNDSNVGRTSGPPTFSTPQVPTRVNSPSDVAFDTKDVLSGGLSFTPTILNASFTAANSILNGINPMPGQTTGGEGPVTGQEVQFDVSFTAPFNLPAGHYFFVPQINLSSGDFFWLSAAGPALFPGDLQAWIRNGNLDPDWLRQGTDIVGSGVTAPKFNDSFSLAGTLPDSGSTFVLFTCAAAILFSLARRFRAT